MWMMQFHDNEHRIHLIISSLPQGSSIEHHEADGGDGVTDNGEVPHTASSTTHFNEPSRFLGNEKS
jgi:hypothetical protein